MVTKEWTKRHGISEHWRRPIVIIMQVGDVIDLQVLANLEADHIVSALKRAELITKRNGSIQIIDRPRLIRHSQFDGDYMHNWRLNFRLSTDEADDQVMQMN